MFLLSLVYKQKRKYGYMGTDSLTYCISDANILLELHKADKK